MRTPPWVRLRHILTVLLSPTHTSDLKQLFLGLLQIQRQALTPVQLLALQQFQLKPQLTRLRLERQPPRLLLRLGHLLRRRLLGLRPMLRPFQRQPRSRPVRALLLQQQVIGLAHTPRGRRLEQLRMQGQQQKLFKRQRQVKQLLQSRRPLYSQ